MHNKATLDAIGAVIREVQAALVARIEAVETRTPPKDGAPGVGVRSVVQDGDKMVVALTNGETFPLALPRGERGADGAPGIGIREIVQDGIGAVRFILETGDSVRVDLPKGERGERGADGAPGIGIKSIAECGEGEIEFEFDNGATATVKLPKGEQGERGERGADGVDRFILAPRYIADGERVEKNEIAYWGGGLHQAIRTAHGSPAEDPGSWRCVVSGVESVEIGVIGRRAR
jgi:hypothetical protein